MITNATHSAEKSNRLPTISESECVDTRVNAANLLTLLEKQGYRCALSGRELTPETLALDHITPVGSGGEHVMGNVQFLHTDVNAAKGTMDQTAFVEMCREITEHTPLQSGSL